MRYMMIWTITALFAVTASPAFADDPPPTAPPAAAAQPSDDFPTELNDPAFARYVSMDDLREALGNNDAAGLADAALQLAEGERVLFRSHKGLTAATVFRLAIRVAAEGRDLATLERLGKAAKAQKDDTLVGMVEAATKLASAARKAEPVLAVNLDKISPEAIILYRSFVEQIKSAKALGSRDRLDTLAKTVKDADELDEKVRAVLGKQIADATAALPDKADPETDVLARLAMASRGWKPKDLDPFNKNSGINKTFRDPPYLVHIKNPSKFKIDYEFNDSKTSVSPGTTNNHKGEAKTLTVKFFIDSKQGSKKYTIQSGFYHFEKRQNKDGSWFIDLYKD